jgi:hypothetical protein
MTSVKGVLDAIERMYATLDYISITEIENSVKYSSISDDVREALENYIKHRKLHERYRPYT